MFEGLSEVFLGVGLVALLGLGDGENEMGIGRKRIAGVEGSLGGSDGIGPMPVAQVRQGEVTLDQSVRAVGVREAAGGDRSCEGLFGASAVPSWRGRSP